MAGRVASEAAIRLGAWRYALNLTVDSSAGTRE